MHEEVAHASRGSVECGTVVVVRGAQGAKEEYKMLQNIPHPYSSFQLSIVYHKQQARTHAKVGGDTTAICHHIVLQ